MDKTKEATMTTIGVDFSKRTSVFSVLDQQGNRIMRRKIVNDSKSIHEFLDSIPGPKRLAMEASRNWGMMHEAVKGRVDFTLGHPKKMKAITESETKNDNNDADLIAKLHHSGFLPKAYAPSQEIRNLRSLVRFRRFCVEQRKSVRNQVSITIDRNVWPADRPLSFKNPFCKRGRAWLNSLNLLETERIILNECLKSFDQLTERITNLQADIERICVNLPGLKYLRTVPGFRTGKVNIYAVLLEIGDISRFRKARHLAHYAGLVPREYSSGDKHRTGRLVKQANMHLRTAMLESTLMAIRLDPGLRQYYKQVKERSGSGSAIVACARKLIMCVYHVLKEQRPYRAFDMPPAAAFAS